MGELTIGWRCDDNDVMLSLSTAYRRPFYSSPYLLHLIFPSPLLYDAETCLEAYDPSDQNEMLTLVMCKQENQLCNEKMLEISIGNFRELCDVTTRREVRCDNKERESSNTTPHSKFSMNIKQHRRPIINRSGREQ